MGKCVPTMIVASLLMMVSLSNLANVDGPVPAPVPPQQNMLAALNEPPVPQVAADPIQTQLGALTDRMNNFINEYNSLEDKSRLRLDLLENENAALKSQVRELDKRIANLAELQTQYSNKNILLIALGFAGLLIWLAVLTFRRRDKAEVFNHNEPYIAPEESDIEDEYDYLGSEEGIAAKLDLARAYIDMDDPDQAREALQDVLKSGDASQQAAARELLEQLEADTVH